MGPRRELMASAVLALLVFGAAAVGATPAQETPEQPAVDNTVTRIELAADGSARWTVTIRTRLATSDDIESYEAFQARFRANSSRFTGPFRSRIAAVVEGAAAATGRDMAATNFTAETRIQEVPRRWGIVEYAFTWVGFAAVEGDVVVMGDAFAGGFFLADADTLVVAPPPGYRVGAAEPSPTRTDDGTVSWTGRQDFADGRPLVRTVPADGAVEGGPTGLLARRPAVGAAAVALLVVAGLAAVVYRRRTGGPAAERTDEERVLELLDARGGRVQQSAVVETFGWSTSKTSRLLSRMADDGTIEKLQLGRENLVRLPDDED